MRHNKNSYKPPKKYNHNNKPLYKPLYNKSIYNKQPFKFSKFTSILYKNIILKVKEPIFDKFLIKCYTKYINNNNKNDNDIYCEYIIYLLKNHNYSYALDFYNKHHDKINIMNTDEPYYSYFYKIHHITNSVGDFIKKFKNINLEYVDYIIFHVYDNELIEKLCNQYGIIIYNICIIIFF